MTDTDPTRDGIGAPVEAATLPESMAWDAPLLSRQLRYVAANSDFYAERWSASVRDSLVRCDPDDAEALLRSLPLTTKNELRIAEEERPPFGTHLACGEDRVALVHRTSGTTGRPLVVAATAADSQLTSSRGGVAFACAGLGPGNVVVHCLNYCMWAGGVTDHRCLEATGAAVVPFGVGNTKELIELQRWLPFDTLSATPSYVRLLLERLSGAELELWRRNLSLILAGGEPGGSEIALRRAVAGKLGARLVNANYGLAEVLSNFGSECEAQSDMHFHGHGAVWIELLDEDGRPQPPAAGAKGEVVLTHLRREAQPLVRYRTNDLMEIVATDRCSCGRGSFRFRLHGRTDDMFVVRGINVFPAAIARALGSVSTSLGEFAIVLPDAQTFDRVPLLVEAEGDQPDDVGSRIETSIRDLIGCGAEVSVLRPGTLPRTNGKTRRIYRDGAVPDLRAG